MSAFAQWDPKDFAVPLTAHSSLLSAVSHGSFPILITHGPRSVRSLLLMDGGG